VLIATDCLSEGVNLQDAFSAVVHYDLAWNPTRHEQREGRVDRFGQTSDIVRAVTVYGQDNHVDQIVLDVLLRKHEAIRKATGVSVPVPASSDTVLDAVLEQVLLNPDTPSTQLTLDLTEPLNEQWASAAEREKTNRTRYAQRTIHPDEVARELAEIRDGLGTGTDIATFTRYALTGLGAQVRDQANGTFSTDLAELPLALRETLRWLRPAGARGDQLRFHPDLPAPRGDAVLARTDSHVEALARFVLDGALDDALPEALRPARRCGVTRTSAVRARTTLLLVRCRFHLNLPTRGGDIQALVAEEARGMAFTGPPGNPAWLADEDVRTLIEASAEGNIPPDQARGFATSAVQALDELTPALDKHAHDRAAHLREAHRRVRSAYKPGGRGLTVTAQTPVDILGVYVYLPLAAASATGLPEPRRSSDGVR
jgi:hypothetical protein